ncbi:MAG: DNA (cytosine-5-)-methyltransferase [Anaerolineales bacterium]|nr:DNA (cytosine-5-)-methyltransferase [Anaerolineales bacterium]
MMRRKDGKPKRKARRTMPEYEGGYKDNPKSQGLLNPAWHNTPLENSYAVISLFSGCGGLDLGLLGGFSYLGEEYSTLPLEIIGAYDNNPDSVETYNLNLGEHASLMTLTEESTQGLARADILIGGFPCQDFSSSGGKLGFGGARGELYKVLLAYMRFHQPQVVIAENVPYLAKLSGGDYLATIVRDFESAGYHFDIWELYGPDYGLPQSRRRLFIIGVRDDIQGFPAKPSATHLGTHVPIAEAISDLETITDESIPNQSQYFVATRAKAGGGQGDHTNAPDRVAYCIRANARGRIQFHYALPRRLTVRESARLQSFPDEFVFPFSTQRNFTMIGNAVPPILAHFVGRSIHEFLAAVHALENISETFRHTYPLLVEQLDVEQLSFFSAD